MTYANVADVAGRWVGATELAPAEGVQKYLEDAETMLAWEIRDLHDRAKRDQGLRDRIVLVECRMVIRALKNPDLKRQVSHTTGPFTESSTFGAETLTGLTVTAEDLSLLEPSDRSRQRAFTIEATTPAEGKPCILAVSAAGNVMPE